MANPQKENGYVAIANELFEALIRIRISGEARQVLDVIFRKTYGFRKKEDRIALSQFCLMTGMSKTTVCKALTKLQSMKIISKKGNGSGNIYRVNKDFDEWKPLPKREMTKGVSKKGNERIPKRKKGVSKKVTYKRQYTKATLTKDSMQSDSDFPEAEVVLEMQDLVIPEVSPPREELTPAISEIISTFKEVNWGYKRWFTDDKEIQAVKNLIEAHGKDQVLEVVRVLPKTNLVKYTPRVLSPSELEEKWTRLELQIKSMLDDNDKKKILI